MRKIKVIVMEFMTHMHGILIIFNLAIRLQYYNRVR